MRLFGKKKTRSSKAATLKATSSLGRLNARLRNRDVLLRLTMVLAAVAAMLLAVEAWKPAFPYRSGEFVGDGIMARISFRRVNEFKTERARMEREAEVPGQFKNDPQPLLQVPDRFREDLLEISGANSPDELSFETRQAFGLLPKEDRAGAVEGNPANSVPAWTALKAAVDGPQGMLEQRVDRITTELRQLLSPLTERGVIDPVDLAERDLLPEDAIKVVGQTSNDDSGLILKAADVLMSEILKPSGILGKDLKNFETLVPIQLSIERWLLTQTPPTLSYDEQGTLEARLKARDNVPIITDDYERGALLVAPGQRLNGEARDILQSHYDALQADVTFPERILRVLTVAVLLLVLSVVNGYYIIRNESRLVKSVVRLGVYLATVVMTVAFARVLAVESRGGEVIPLLCTVMVLSIAYNQVLATLTGFSIALVLTLSIGAGLGDFVVLIASLSTAILPLSHVSSRSSLIKVGFGTAFAYFLVSWGIGILESQGIRGVWNDSTLLTNSLLGAGWCLAAGYLVAGSLPFIESAFGVITDISLLELGDVSHPLLQELVRRAPGTYNHSMTVASIAETAADSIGANGLLCRVGAYFHDIGKMLKPHYFIENVVAGTGSRHEHLAPAMSTLIIIGHVKDGVDLANQHHLPEPLIDFIEQHHGTTLVEYFYHAAAKKADSQPDHKGEVVESSFRYPGPKPQSRETGVMMLADCVESASRALSEPTPKRLETLVHDLTMKRLLDGQFDESSLTLSDIRQVEDSLTKSLIAIYHGRIKYPEQKSA